MKRTQVRQPASCYFCKQGSRPVYKEVSKLERFLSDRGQILSRSKTGLCQKHQRKLTQEVKRARHLALLSFVNKF